VIVKQPTSTYFLNVLGYSSLNVSARAVSGAVTGPACIYALDSSAASAIGITGNFTINAACGVIDDSNSSTALSATGNGTVTATSMGVVGNYSAVGNVTLSPTPIPKIAPLGDPMAGLAAPTVGPCTQQTTGVKAGSKSYKAGSKSYSGNISSLTVPAAVYASGFSVTGNIGTVFFSGGTYGNGINFNGNGGNLIFNPGQYQNGSGTGASITLNGNTATSFTAGTYTFCGPVSIIGNNTTTLQPGLYLGGISITGNAKVTFSPGTYILAGGGLAITGNSTIHGTGVTFYDTSSTSFAYKPINITGNETGSLSAPTSGPMEAMLFFQDRSVANIPPTPARSLATPAPVWMVWSISRPPDSNFSVIPAVTPF
jgi:hypothetical protein